METKWNEEKHKNSITSHVNKIIKDLGKEGITIQLNDSNSKLNNIVASKKGKTIKMSHWSFYRYSGSGYKLVRIDDKTTELVKITLKDWLENIIKPIIIYKLRDN